MNKLFLLNRIPWPLRLPVKWAIFAVTLLAVCFPYPDRLVRHVRHWRNPDALIEPDAPAIAPLIEELDATLPSGLSARETLKAVEKFVYDKIAYDWDWNTWGTADYLPTVTEVIEKGKEDCDGRAVVAASLLSHLGFNAAIVTDFAHVWVKTDEGETMGPGKKKAVVAGKDGLQLQRGALGQLPKALAYAIGPFPLVRELVLIFVIWLLLLRANGGVGCGLTGLAFLLAGLLILKKGGEDYSHPVVWMQYLGGANLLAGFLTLLVWARYNARHASGSPHRAAAGADGVKGL